MTLLQVLFGLLLFSSVSAAIPYEVFRENGKSGLKDSHGNVLIPPHYDAIGWSSGSFSVVDDVTGYKQGDEWGIIDINNKRISGKQFRELYPAEGSYLIAGRADKVTRRVTYGCVSTTGKQLIPFQYDGIELASLRAIVFSRIGNQYRYGLVDLQNKTILPQQYQHIEPFGTLRFAVRNFEGKLAIFSDNGHRVTEFAIDSVTTLKKGLSVFYQGGYRGLLGRDGTIKLDAKYRDINIVNETTVEVRMADEWLLLSGKNELIHNVGADSVVAVGPSRFKISLAGQARLVNEKLQPITSAILTDIGRFQLSKAPYKLGRLYGVLQNDGKVVVPALYQQIITAKAFILAKTKVQGLDGWLLFDSLGNRTSSRVYQSIKPLSAGLFVAQHRNYYGLLNGEGRELLACVYDSILDMKDNMVSVKFKGLYGVITLDEEWVVAPGKNRIAPISLDRFVEFTPSSALLKQRKGSVIYFTSNPITVNKDHLLEYLPSGAIWKIDLDGTIADRRVVPDEPTEAIYEESEGYRAIKRNGRYGFIDSRGRLRIANRYEGVQPFREGLAAVKILGKWGFVDLQDRIAVQPVYDEVQQFQKGFAIVTQKGFSGVIDRRGKVVLPVRYQKITLLETGNLLIQHMEGKGLADNKGRILVQPKHERLFDTGEGFVVVAREGKYGVINYDGVATIAPMYNYISFDPSTGFFIAHRKSQNMTVTLR